jgi:hypothetical protein
MADKLSWDEIKRRYPDEWVVLVDYSVEGVDVAEGAVVAHSKSRDDVYDSLKETRPRDCAVLYAGKVTGGLFGFVDEK